MENDMEQKKARDGMARWGALRSKGMWPYILKYGVVFWGITTAVLYSAMLAFARRAEPGFSFWLLLGTSLVLFPTGGIFWGAVMWYVNEMRYKRRVLMPQEASGVIGREEK